MRTHLGARRAIARAPGCRQEVGPVLIQARLQRGRWQHARHRPAATTPNLSADMCGASAAHPCHRLLLLMGPSLLKLCVTSAAHPRHHLPLLTRGACHITLP